MLRTYAASLDEDFSSDSNDIAKENSFTNIYYLRKFSISLLSFLLAYVVLFPFFFPSLSFSISILYYF